MIILPDRNIARSKYLPPMHRRIWQHHDGLNIHFQTWVAQLYRPDHSMVWQGHFEDREDADEFMAALRSGTIKQDGYLRRLPIHCPDFDPDLLRDPSISYNMVTNIGIGPSEGTWIAPGDCYGMQGRAGEFADAIGPGGGGAGTPAIYTATGGGGGGFARLVGVTLWPGYYAPFRVGSGGAGGKTYPDFPADQNPAGGAGGSASTYFKSDTNAGNGVCANPGGGGTFGNNDQRPGGGGGGGGVAGNFGYAGGRGGNVTSNGTGTGGGGAAGPNGDGWTGGDGGGGSTGGGAANANVTGNIYGPWGPGNGGAAGRGNPVGYGTPGSHYGGGGGAGQNNASVYWPGQGGDGGAGLIVLRYEPTYQHTVTGISPTSGPTGGGQAVVISGTNFVGVTQADIGGSVLTGVSHNSTQIFGTTAAGGAGSYNVNVYTNQGPGVASWYGYTFVSPPSVSSCAPSSGSTLGGNYVAIYGANMSGATSITFGGVAGTALSNIDANGVQCYAPAHAAGAVNVSVTNSYGTGTGTSVYTYVTPPSLSTCTPVRGLTHGGTDVTLTGANLSGTTSVTFGGTAATNLVVVNSTTITCRTPAHTRGLVDVVATNPYGAATLTNGFDYLLPASGFNMPMGI
jgi:hypothetical protein